MADSFGPVRGDDGAGCREADPAAESAGSSAGEPIRVLVVDDHALFRRGLEIVLAQEEDIQVAGEAGTARRPWTRRPTCCRTSC